MSNLNKEGASQELIDMLKYFEKTNENTENISNSSKIKLLKEKVKLIKSNDKVGVKLMNSWEKEIEIKEEGREEGIKEGAREREFEIASKMKEMKMSVSDIAQATNLTKQEIEKL